MAELTIGSVGRKEDKKRHGIARTIRVLLDLIIVKFLLDYSTRPGQFFGLVGVGSTALSVLLWLVLAFDKFYFYITLIKGWGPVMFLAVALLLVGVPIFCMGLLGDIMPTT